MEKELLMYKAIIKDIDMELLKAREISDTEVYQDLCSIANDISQMIDILEHKVYPLPRGAERR